MKSIRKTTLVILLLLFFITSIYSPKTVFALRSKGPACEGGRPTGVNIKIPEYEPGMNHTITVNLNEIPGLKLNEKHRLRIWSRGNNISQVMADSPFFTPDENIENKTQSLTNGKITVSNWLLTWVFDKESALSFDPEYVSGEIFDITIQEKYDDETCIIGSYSAGDMSTGSENIPFEICDQISDTEQSEKCLSCMDGTTLGVDDKNNIISGIWTAVGCIPTKPESIVKTFIKLGLSIGGGVTLLLILAGAFQLSVSQGDPKKTDDAKQQITAAITGLIFIILSVAILQFIGVSLFQIPGFGT